MYLTKVCLIHEYSLSFRTVVAAEKHILRLRMFALTLHLEDMKMQNEEIKSTLIDYSNDKKEKDVNYFILF